MKTPPPERRPNLLGIGAAKAGTTWLATVLSAHPEIFVHPQKELNALIYGDLEDRLDEYAAYFEAAGGARVRCDFSVRYLSHDLGPERAARWTPDAKLLLVVRNPVDQVQSHYWHLRRQNFHQGVPVVDAPDLFEALERYPKLLREPALYGRHVRRWLEHFDRDRLLILESRDLRGTGQDAAMARICDFLGVGRFDFSAASQETSAREARSGVQPRSGVAGRVFPRLYVAIASGPYMWLKRTLGVRAGEGIKRALRLRQITETVFFKPGYPALEQAGRERLFSLFAEDIAQFSAYAPFARNWSA